VLGKMKQDNKSRS